MKAASPLRFVGQAPPPRFSVVYGDEEQLLEEARLAVRAQFSANDIHRLAAETIADSPLAGGGGLLFGEQRPNLYEITVAAAPSAAAQAAMVALAAHTKPPDSVLVVMHGMEARQAKTAWFKKISDGAVCVHADRLSAAAAAEWIARWVRAENLTLSKEAAQLLATQTEGNLYAAKQAIAKLALTAADDMIDAGAARRALADGAQYDIFDLSDAILGGKGVRALRILRQLRAVGVGDPLILWCISDILNGVAAVRGGEAPRFWGARLAGLRAIAGRMSVRAFGDFWRLAAHADRVGKGVETGDVSLALARLVIHLAALQRGVKINLPDFQ